MLTAFSALNESSNLETSSDESNYEQDFHDEDYVNAYNSALELYGKGNLTSAETHFRNLLHSDYFRQYGHDGRRPHPVAKKLQFNSLRYLGIILGNKESYEEALDYLQRAINIDQTDVTLYFKLALYAAKFKKFHLARSALEESLFNQQAKTSDTLSPTPDSEGDTEKDSQSYVPIRHWPTLDLLITMTYKLGDFFACLRYIDIALHENADFEKGHKLKKRIYDECPYLDPDPSNWNKEPVITSFKWSQVPKPKSPEKLPVRLTISSWDLKNLAKCFSERYEACGNAELLLDPCIVEYEEKPEEEAEKPVEKKIDESQSTANDVNTTQCSEEDDDEVIILGSDDDDDVVIVEDDSDEDAMSLDDSVEEEECKEVDDIESSVKKVVDTVIDRVMEDVELRSRAYSCDVVSPIVSDVVDSIVETSTQAFIQRILFGVVDSSVTESYSFVNNLSSASKRKAGVNQFLNEVPLDLIEKRRSARTKAAGGSGIGEKSLGTSGENTLSSPRCEEVTAKQLLQGYFPSTLLSANYNKLVDIAISPEKRLSEGNVAPSEHKIPLTAGENEKKKWLSCEEEKDLVEKFIQSFCSSSRWVFLTQLEEFLATLVEKLGDNSWPNDLCDIYLKCYLRWRGHQHFPDEFVPQVPHRFIPVIITANEILLQTKFNENTKSDDDEVDDVNKEEVSTMDEDIDCHFKEDLQHLIYNLFRVEPRQAVRILSLQLNDFKLRDRQRQAIVVGDRLKDFIMNHSLQDVGEIHSPVRSYQVFTTKMLEAYVEKLEQTRLFSQICELYDKHEYKIVRQILESNLPRKVKRKENFNVENRLFHLKMMIDTLWNLDAYKECMEWIEIAIHETKQQMQNKNNANNTLDITAKQFIDLLKSLDCCLCMFDRDDDFTGIEEPFRARLANNLLDLCLEQVEGQERFLDGEKTTRPWVLLYKLISFAEQQQNDVDVECPPGSISFLCSAHDYLGQLSMCTKDDGRLLIIQGDAIVAALFKGLKVRAMADQLRKNLDQAMFCLYAHPSKKSKLKHLVDHSVSNIALRWDRCMSSFQYLRPEKLPEYDDFKSNSILAETVLFFKRIVALIPDQLDLQGRNNAVKEYLTSGSETAEFPKFCKVLQKDRPLLDVLYLLADYYFKNNEFTTALEYYRYDLCFNQDRVDSWFPLALSLVNVLEQKLNETYKDPSTNKILELTSEVINKILGDSDVILKCYARCHILSHRNSMIRIESANFAYTMNSFCTRQLEMLDSSEEDLKTKLTDKAPRYLEYASSHYGKALQLMEAQDEPDEMWLLHFMKGKICEKDEKSIKDCLSEYLKSLDRLLEQNATLPKKISYNSPPELALELLEVYYRIHATILKQDFLTSSLSTEIIDYIWGILKKIDNSKIFAGNILISSETKAKEDKSQSSETDSSEPPSKMAKLDDVQEEATWEKISIKCVEALESITKRFPQHFKTIHLLGRYYLKTSKGLKDTNKAQKYLWGQNVGASGSASKTSTLSMALFGERKSNNLFNGIWRLPISEVDRAGSFSTHISKCITTLLDLAMEMKEQSIFLEVASQLRKPPDGYQKYLYEKQRKSLAQKSYTLLKTVLRTKVEEHIKFGSSQETRLGFLFEMYQIYLKLRRSWHTKDESVGNLLLDLFKSMGNNQEFLNAIKAEDIINFCMKVSSMSKKGMDSPQVLATLVKGDPVEFMRKEMQSPRSTEMSKGSPISSATAHSVQGSSSKVSQLAAESSLSSGSAAAAMEYLNAASSYYSNELAKMAAYLQTASGYSTADAQALLSAYASYGLLESVSQQKQPSYIPSAKSKDNTKRNTTTTTQRSSLPPTIDLTSSSGSSTVRKPNIVPQKSTTSSVTISRISQTQQQNKSNTATSSSSKGVQMFSNKSQGNSSGQAKSNSISISKFTPSNPYAAKQAQKKGNVVSNSKGPSSRAQGGTSHMGTSSAYAKAKQVLSSSTSGQAAKSLMRPGAIPAIACREKPFAGDAVRSEIKNYKELMEKNKNVAKQPRLQGSGSMTVDNRPKPKPSQLRLQPKTNPLTTNTSTVVQSKPKSKLPTSLQTASSTSQPKPKQAQSLLKSDAQKNKPTAKLTLQNDDDEVICID